MSTATGSPQPSQRLLSLDALRGFDMFWILGGDSLAYALHRMSGDPLTRMIAMQLDHVEWSGVHAYDLIFPTFVFIMGVSTVFALTGMLAREGRARTVRRILVRGVILFALGLIYNGGLANSWPDVRIMGVLGRIALCYVFGGIAFCFFRPRALCAMAATLLLGYWALMALVPFPDVRPVPGGTTVITKEAGFRSTAQLRMDSTVMLTGSYIQGVNLADYLDQKYLPGRKYDGTYDPEGILSTIPAFATGLLGILAGTFLRNSGAADRRKAAVLAGAGAVSVLVGFAWGIEFPVVKKIWTSSYVLVAGGFSSMLLGLFYWVIEVKGMNRWCLPFVWIGMNPITLYMASDVLNGFDGLAARVTGGSVSSFLDVYVARGCGDLVTALAGIALFLALARFLYKRKIFIRV
jgi:predicted acyltransferase